MKRTQSTKEEPLKDWTQINPPHFIDRRAYHSSVYYKDSLYIYGGYQANSGILNSFIKFSFTPDKQWEKISRENSPGARHGHTAILYHDKMLIFGGKVSSLSNTNTLYQFDFLSNSWTRILQKGQIPQGIDCHSAILYEDSMIIYGGFNKDRYSSKIYQLNLQSYEWKLLFNDNNKGLFPVARSNCSINVINSKLYIFGGTNLEMKFNDLWYFDLKTYKFNYLEAINPPEKRSGHTTVVYNDNLVLFGGIQSITRQRNDLLMYDVKNNQWKTIWKDTKQQYQKQSKEIVEEVNEKNDVVSIKKTQLKNSNIAQKSLDGEDSKNDKVKKYRNQLKQVNYYNSQQLQLGIKERTKKDQTSKMLLSVLKLANGQEGTDRENSINSSIMWTGFNFACSFIKSDHSQDNFSQNKIIGPKARDGHSACLIEGHLMVIFGGDEHMLSYNTIIIIDLQKNIQLASQEELTLNEKLNTFVDKDSNQ